MPENDSDQQAGGETGGAESGGGEAPTGATHQLRFVARTLDGEEVYSAPLNLTPGEGAALQAKIAAAYWGHAQYVNGDTAYACAGAHNAEGAVVRFIIEKSEGGGGWTPAADLKAKVKDEKAVAAWPLPNMPKGSKIRFRAQTAVSKQTSLESTVGDAAPAPAQDQLSSPPPAGKPAPAPAAAKPAPAPAKPPPTAAKPAPAPAKPAPTAAKPAPAPAKPAPAPAKPAPAPAKPAPAPAKPAPAPAKPAPAPAKPAPAKPAPAPAKPAPAKPAPAPAKPAPAPAKPAPAPAKPAPAPAKPAPAPAKPAPAPAKPAPAPAKPPPPPPPPAAKHGECIVFQDADFKGWQLKYDKDCDWIGDRYNDQISSIKVVSGRWRFYEDIHYGGKYLELGPGDLKFVGKAWNDRISSFKQIDAPAGAPPAGKPPPAGHQGGGGGHAGGARTMQRK